jgi:hypothetical protein
LSGPKSNVRKQALEALAKRRVQSQPVPGGGVAPVSKRHLRWLQVHWKDRFMASTGAITRKGPKVGRNDPCPCGQTIDGKPVKFKNCCGE